MRKFISSGFWRLFPGKTFSALGLIGVLLDFVNFAFVKIPISGFLLTSVLAFISILYGVIASWPRAVRQHFDTPNTSVEIVRGDLFDQGCSIVVGMTDTFDTSFPVISNESIQGQMLTRIFENDTNQLDKDISEALKYLTPVSTANKIGKTSRYPIGTVATIKAQTKHLYLLAYSSMNDRNEAHSSIDDVWHSLTLLWKEVSLTSNGKPLAIPVIGGGQSRISQLLPAQDSIRLIAMSFMFASRKHKISDSLRIVVQPSIYDRLNIYELSIFLTSLSGRKK